MSDDHVVHPQCECEPRDMMEHEICVMSNAVTNNMLFIMNQSNLCHFSMVVVVQCAMLALLDNFPEMNEQDRETMVRQARDTAMKIDAKFREPQERRTEYQRRNMQ